MIWSGGSTSDDVDFPNSGRCLTRKTLARNPTGQGQSEAVFILAKSISLCQYVWDFQKNVCWETFSRSIVQMLARYKPKKERVKVLWLQSFLPNKQACLAGSSRLSQGSGWTGLKQKLWAVFKQTWTKPRTRNSQLECSYSQTQGNWTLIWKISKSCSIKTL